jgi:predicted nucleic acid-binding protein
MAVLVDTNVIFDLLHNDPIWVHWARTQLAQHAGQLIINPLIYAELCYEANSPAEVDELVEGFGFRYEELPHHALFLAAKAYRTYRARGGIKTSPLPDFFIGAHAQVLGIPIITRDQDRYRTYFPAVPLISP